MKVITLTVNPALDKSAKVDGILPEQKLRCYDLGYQPGGGGINISRILSRLGVSSQCLFTSGGDNGKQIEALLKKEHIDSIPISVQQSTRENFSVVDTNTGQQYRFGMPGSSFLSEELEKLNDTISSLVERDDILALSGSLGSETKSDFYVEIIKRLETKGVRIVLDSSGDALLASINQRIELIKPNQKELALLAGEDFLTTKKQEDFAMSLVEAKQIAHVVVSMGARGAFMASKAGILYQQSPSIPVRSTIGAGDSMVAGLIYGMIQSFTAKEMLKYGVACGSATTMSEGTNLASKENIQKTLELLS